MDDVVVLPTAGGLTPEESLGAQIRKFRLDRGLSLRDLARRALTSPGFVSQLERGQVNASVSMLRKLSEVLRITLPDLFREDDVSQPRVRRRADRQAIPTRNLKSKYLLLHKPLENLEVYAAEFLPGEDAGEAYTHGDAQEMLVITAGTVTLELAGVEYVLCVGDSAEYRTSVLHTVRNASAQSAEVMWIISA